MRRVICGFPTKGYGQVFTRLLRRLANESTDTADSALIDHLANRSYRTAVWPDDAELLKSFLEDPLYQWMTRGRLQLVLKRIEEHMPTPQAETTTVPDPLQIEHIMPQGWRAHWPLLVVNDGDEERRDHAIHTIGNLTLVNGKLNKTLSNAPWGTKRDALAEHSVLFLNTHLVREGPQVWNEVAIEDRARWLHAMAVKVWPHHRAIGSSG